jgi:sRNA-binding carbon storage regulator CsrA
MPIFSVIPAKAGIHVYRKEIAEAMQKTSSKLAVSESRP